MGLEYHLNLQAQKWIPLDLNVSIVVISIFSEDRPRVEMEFSLRHQLSTQVRLHIYTYFLIYIIVAVSGERTLYPTESDNSRDFKTLWDVYILPHLEHDLNSKYEHAIETNVEEDNYSDMPGNSSRLKPRLLKITSNVSS